MTANNEKAFRGGVGPWITFMIWIDSIQIMNVTNSNDESGIKENRRLLFLVPL